MRYWILSVLVASAVLLQGGFVRADELSLSQALKTAYTGNPTLRAARSELLATHELLPQAQAGWKPTLSADGSVLVAENDGSNFGGGDGSTSKDVEVSFDQPVFRGFRTVAEMAGAEAQVKAQSALLASVEQDILLDAATAYMDVLRDDGLVELGETNFEVLEQELEATRDRFDVGELTRTDVSQAQARLARAESDLINARGDLRSSRAVFEQVIGLSADRLKKPKTLPSVPENLEEAAVIAQERSPEVITATYAHKAAEEGVDNVFGELLPTLNLSGSWNRTYDPQPGLINETTTKSVGFSASIPLYKAGSVRSRVRQAKHEANQRYMKILESKQQARQEAITNWEALQTARAEIKSRQAQVEASKIAREGVYAEKDVGSRTILDSLDADQELLDAQIALVTAERNEVVALFTLAATLGALTPETLGFSSETIDLSDNLNDVTHKIFDMDVDSLRSAE